jgi:hypothetical protein
MDETPLTTGPPAPRQQPFSARAGAPAIAEDAFTIDLISNHRGSAPRFWRPCTSRGGVRPPAKSAGTGI